MALEDNPDLMRFLGFSFTTVMFILYGKLTVYIRDTQLVDKEDMGWDLKKEYARRRRMNRRVEISSYVFAVLSAIVAVVNFVWILP